jgi:hypothetical protein
LEIGGLVRKTGEFKPRFFFFAKGKEWVIVEYFSQDPEDYY